MRRSTIIYILLFAAVFGAAYYFNSRPEPADIAIETEAVTPLEYLYDAGYGLPVRIHIAAKAGEVVEVERNAENAWALKLPTEAAADQGSVEAAASQVATIRIMQRVPNIAPKDVGLDNPEYILTVKFTSGVERILTIGVITPTESGYYARGEDGEIVIVSKNALDALLGLLTAPPYAAAEPPPLATP